METKMEKKTALYAKHLALHATMVDFAGWSMPIQYKSLKEEVLLVRKSCGVFDVSHMGEFLVTGEGAQDFVNYLLPNEFATLPEGKALYSPLLNEDGFILDDLIVYKISSHKILICVNASNKEKDFQWIKKIHTQRNEQCSFIDLSEDCDLLAVQGPESVSHLSNIFPEAAAQLKSTPYYGVFQYPKNNPQFIFARTGYTGEDGYEVFCIDPTHELAPTLWDKLLASGAMPCGLGARDCLRLEVAYPLYGQELSEELTPLDCGLKWTIKLDKKSFVGKEKLLSYESKFKQVKLSIDQGIPRKGYKIYNSDHEIIGSVSSGTMSPHLGKGIALASVYASTKNNDRLFIEIRDKKVPAIWHTKAFINGGHL
jgi:aminomethyltransferase